MSQMPPGQPTSYTQPPARRTNGLAIASMILGIISIVVCCFNILSIILGILAIVLGVLGRGKVTRGEAGGGGMAITGIICGVIGLILGVILFSLVHFGGPAMRQRLEQWKIQVDKKVEEEKRKEQEREKQGSTSQESLLQQELKARNLAIVLD